ncbi:isocitrate/isopropylmalate family dehydrogenase [Streptomyces europaeiscabiei]|uniref:isocitrate/isopropylmalate family dehydrogenase n=1 Tax=Streptomyces europaeiscabiei TaxID=146819 RepID=UPI002E17AA1D
MTTIALLPGDGIGSEILDGPLTYLRRLQSDGAPLSLTGPFPYGTTGWMQSGSILPPETVDACRKADVVLSGAVGAHPGVTSAQCPNPEAALIELRHIFDLRVSIRTVWVPGSGSGDVVIVRNITGGAYASPDQRQESDGVRTAEDLVVLRPDRVREVFAIAADYAARQPGRRAISVDKASVFATSRLWRRIAHESGTAFDDVNVDRAAYELVKYPELPGVIVTEGIFGDILSDIVCARAGSPALCGSATVNPDRAFGNGVTALFEPAHGTAPHRTGSRRSNPTGAWLALADLLDWCPDLQPLGLSGKIRAALEAAVADGPPTYDLAPGGATDLSDMDQFNKRVLGALE